MQLRKVSAFLIYLCSWKKLSHTKIFHTFLKKRQVFSKSNDTFLKIIYSFLKSACDICTLLTKNQVRRGALLKKTHTALKNVHLALENQCVLVLNKYTYILRKWLQFMKDSYRFLNNISRGQSDKICLAINITCLPEAKLTWICV